jgi:hypothetical protein
MMKIGKSDCEGTFAERPAMTRLHRSGPPGTLIDRDITRPREARMLRITHKAALKGIEAALLDAGIPFAGAGAGPQTILVRRAPDP